ncbi:MAG: AbiV family abortive infection protein [Vicinamibacterales bacterium]|nr:AbiV family abortive infection protein [Vicinamibacterales bacterium]
MHPLTLPQLYDVHDAILGNARSLIADAELLESKGRFARAFSLAVLACEELAKSMFVNQACVAVALGRDVDWTTLGLWLRQHGRKLAVMRLLDVLSSPDDARSTLFLEKVESETLIAHPSEINIAKQDGFYVDISDDGTAIVPAEVVADGDARAAIELAGRGLALFEEATHETRHLLRKPQHYAERVERIRVSLRPIIGQLKTMLGDN